MRVRFTAINLEFSINGSAEPIVGDHSADGTLDQQFGMPRPTRPQVFRFVPPHISGKAHIGFLLFLFAGDAHFFGIHNNDEITGVDMGGKNSFLLAA